MPKKASKPSWKNVNQNLQGNKKQRTIKYKEIAADQQLFFYTSESPLTPVLLRKRNKNSKEAKRPQHNITLPRPNTKSGQFKEPNIIPTLPMTVFTALINAEAEPVISTLLFQQNPGAKRPGCPFYQRKRHKTK